MIDAFLITKVIKTLLAEIKNLRELRLKRASKIDSSNSFVTQKISFVDEIVEQIDREQTISSKSLAEKSIFVETAFDKILSFEDLSEKVDSFELFSLFETIDQEQETDIIERLQTSLIEHLLSSETSSRILHETRVQSESRIARVQAEMQFFQFFHLTNLRELFISHTFISHTRASFFAHTVITSEDRFDKFLSEEYSANASSIATHHFNYQSLQKLVQRNFDFLISILSRSQSKLITNQFAESAFISSTTIESYSKHSNFEPSKKEFNESVFTNHLKRRHTSQLTTSKNVNLHVNSFLLFSTLSFDSLFQQFRFSFFSDSFIFSVRSVSSSRLSAELNSNLNSSRIQKLDDCATAKISFELDSSIHSSTVITSNMFISKENVSSSSMFNLTQQNIQEIVLSMFNLFAQNVQNQAQVRAVETINEAIISIAKKDFFRAFDVRFFDSQLNSSYDSDDVVQVKRDLYYRNVYLFVKRVKDVVIMFDVEVVRTNLSTCLRESTQI